MKKQTAGRDELQEFAPLFAALNDDVLFGEVWAREQELPSHIRSIVTVVTLMASGILDDSLKYHMQTAKQHGVSQQDMAEILTQAAFYAGWPKAWTAFRIAKEVYAQESMDTMSQRELDLHDVLFPLGEKNDTYADYFIGQSYLSMLCDGPVNIAHVSFEPGCRNNWHIHHKGGQILLVTGGIGWYQEWGKPAQRIQAGDVINIAPEVKHWHGASKDHWFAHLAIEVPATDSTNEWLEPVAKESYNQL